MSFRPGLQPGPSQSDGLDAEQEAGEQRERDHQEALDRLRHPPAQTRETAGSFGHAQKSGHLDLFRECVGAEGATQLASALRCDTALQQLGLAEAGVGDAGATPLALALLENCTLTALDLSYNCIGDAGAKRLANALQGNSALTHLGLEGNHITDKGFSELATAVASNCALGHLDLKLNAVRGAAGAKILAATLKDNTTLTCLSLASNELGDAGVAIIAEALKENVGLTRLELAGRDAGIGDACATAVADALGANKTLLHMTLKFHRIGDDDKGEEAAYIHSTKQSLFASLLLGIWCKVESFPPALGETMLVDPTVCGLIKTKYALAPLLQYVPEYPDKIRICVWLPRARSRHVQHMHSLSPWVVHSSQS